jgi:hypothetical protein
VVVVPGSGDRFSIMTQDKTMPPNQQDKKRMDENKQEGERRNAVISQQAIQTLGRPGELDRLQIRQLWQDRYRVNVLVGADVVSAKIGHSFFLVVDRDGNIIESTPKITRQ